MSTYRQSSRRIEQNDMPSPVLKNEWSSLVAYGYSRRRSRDGEVARDAYKWCSRAELPTVIFFPVADKTADLRGIAGHEAYFAYLGRNYNLTRTGSASPETRQSTFLRSPIKDWRLPSFCVAPYRAGDLVVQRMYADCWFIRPAPLKCVDNKICENAVLQRIVFSGHLIIVARADHDAPFSK